MQSLAGGYSQVGGGNGGWTGTATPPLSVPNGHDEVQWRRGGSVGHCGGHGAPLRPTQAPPRPIVVKRPHRGYTLPSRAGNVDSCKRTGHTPKKTRVPYIPTATRTVQRGTSHPKARYDTQATARANR